MVVSSQWGSRGGWSKPLICYRDFVTVLTGVSITIIRVMATRQQSQQWTAALVCKFVSMAASRSV